ncbi:TetR/AcrR family transcriptional regulator [Leucobacter tenebrionis]|uniref:TetR/AcrR family transcriptional regulator n=1 Tax=Leucobacter tenebrionis TaxID=2873270 RepID=UPI001CA7B4DD|nr:TetR/AcrR family transcriptional regulator C-terminal domain-containing protein [Leucobacter tenebrionis]QZY51338.1 TetR/AcrR family transcriptional regulator C-terminal domain-containing protein [Leucobacter tenebrionis]
MARPREAKLSREIIGRAAIEYVEAGNDLQLVPLAKKLGVRVSSLYHHVRGREGVIQAMRHVLVAEYVPDQPMQEDGDWADRVRREVETTWRLYTDHPRSLALMLTVVIDEPDVMRVYSTLVDALVEAGVPDDEILTTVEVIDAFTFGAALDALSPDQILEPEEADGKLGELLPGHLVGRARNRAMFDHGLDLLIEGIRSRVDRASG